MKREDMAKLLGGYAADNLTPEEREALFAAALEDQQLFDALAREQGLRELLRDPLARRELLAALEAGREPWWRRAGAWMRRPAVLAAVGGMAAVVVTLTVWLPHMNRPAPLPPPVMVAQVPKPAAAPPAPAPVEAVPAPPLPRRFAAPRQPAPSPAATQVVELEPPPAAGVFGGVPGGVAGGVISGALPAAPPAPPARPLAAAVRAVAPPSVVRNGALDARRLYLGQPAAAVSTGFVQGERAVAMRRAAGTPNLGLRCRLLRLREDGSLAPVEPNAAWRAGQPVRLSLEPNGAGYLYVFATDRSGAWRLLFSTKAEAGHPYTVSLESGRAAAVLARDELTEPEASLERGLASSGILLLGPGTPEEHALYGVALQPFTREVAFEIPVRRESER